MQRLSDTDSDILTREISELLGNSIITLSILPQERGSSKNVYQVNFTKADQSLEKIILKKSEGPDFLDFYNQFLEPLNLGHPKIYGEISIKGTQYIVSEYVEHITPDWKDAKRYELMIDWLIQKDTECMRHLQEAEGLAYVGKTKFYGVDDWYEEFEKSVTLNNCSAIDSSFWQLLLDHKTSVDEAVKALEQKDPLTVSHGDLQMNNFLFTDESPNSTPVVIDWTQPQIISVCKDLAQVIDCAPTGIRGQLKTQYCNSIHVPDFDETFNSGMLIRDIGYLAWMVLMINEGEPEKSYKEEIERVKTDLQQSI